MSFEIESIGPSDAHAWLRFTLAPGLSQQKQLALLRRFGSAHAVLDARHDDVAQVAGEAGARSLRDGADARLVARTRQWLERPGCRLVGLGDPA
jgi:predicted Rossmann fold nucleotide-binding protein DprA/Smf involved in DNA uptake